MKQTLSVSSDHILRSPYPESTPLEKGMATDILSWKRSKATVSNTPGNSLTILNGTTLSNHYDPLSLNSVHFLPRTILGVCALNGEALRDSRITSSEPVGPFSDEASFNDFLVASAEIFMDETKLPDIRSRMREDHRIVFTHGDLAPRNILVQGGRIVALIDWEQSGWCPEHWELVKAMWSPMAKKDVTWDDRVIALFSEEDKKDWMVDRELSDYLIGGF